MINNNSRYNHVFDALPKKELHEHFEKERQEFLALGMSESAIFLLHYGGDGGYCDFDEWRSERRRIRRNEQFLQVVDPSNSRIQDPRDVYRDIDLKIDAERGMESLTEIQKERFSKVCREERSYVDVADELGKHHSTIQESVKEAKKYLLKKFLSYDPAKRPVPRL
jgi:hypothetical protein